MRKLGKTLAIYQISITIWKAGLEMAKIRIYHVRSGGVELGMVCYVGLIGFPVSRYNREPLSLSPTQLNSKSRLPTMPNEHVHRRWFIVEHGHLQHLPPNGPDFAYRRHGLLASAVIRDGTECPPEGSTGASTVSSGNACQGEMDRDVRTRKLKGARWMFEDDFVRFVAAHQHWRSHPRSNCYQDSASTPWKTRHSPAQKLHTAYRRLLCSYTDLTRLERSAWRTSECLNVDEGMRSFSEVLRRDFPGLQGWLGAEER